MNIVHRALDSDTDTRLREMAMSVGRMSRRRWRKPWRCSMPGVEIAGPDIGEDRRRFGAYKRRALPCCWTT